MSPQTWPPCWLATPIPKARAAAAQAGHAVLVGHMASLSGELPTACRLSAMSRRLVPDLPQDAKRAAAEMVFNAPDREAA